MLIALPPTKARMMQEKTRGEKTMMWVDYTIDQAGPHFTIKGDWPGEVMGWPRKDGDAIKKENTLYQPGDVFKVNENGWLMKQNIDDKES